MTATGIKSYSSTPASNNAAVPNGFPEGMAPSGVNDAARQVMAEIRRWYEDMMWLDFGYTYTYVSTTSFKVSGVDVTAQYPVNRRIRAIGSSTGTIYGVIATSAFSTDTTITITWDSGTLSSETLAVSVGPSFTGTPIPASAVSGISAVTDATIATTDITTNNVSTSKHGWAPKAPNDQTRMLDGTGAYSIPSVIPQNSQSAAYTTVLADAGKHILHPSADTTARTFTIDSNANVAYLIGAVITFVNENAAGTVTIAITSDTMYLAGSGTTGSRTLAANGIATALKIKSTEWIISGTGLT